MALTHLSAKVDIAPRKLLAHDSLLARVRDAAMTVGALLVLLRIAISAVDLCYAVGW
jgi:hypothetical protein